MKRRSLYKPHLAVHETQLREGEEWSVQFRGWCLLHVNSGISYWEEARQIREIPAGSTLVFPADAGAALKASELNSVNITYFTVETGKIVSLLTLREQQMLMPDSSKNGSAVQIIPSPSPVGERVKNLAKECDGSSTSLRLRLLQVFLETLESESSPETESPALWTDGRDRLRQIMDQMAVGDFVDLSVADLAPMVPCSLRHFNRLFREETGVSFREKQIQLRMVRACELLRASDSKVIDVALESGYQSSSVFSTLFKRHFGTSPGRWRREELNSQAAQQYGK